MPRKGITSNCPFFSFPCSSFLSFIRTPSLLPREESQKNLRVTTMISTTITMTFTFTEKSGGISCKAV